MASFTKPARVALLVAAWLGLLSPQPAPATVLEELGRPGPWPAVTGLIVYAGRLWMANGNPYSNTNAAEIYSYTASAHPDARGFRLERNLFSQDAGAPAIIDGLLHWPFEDPRFSARRGEFAVTDGIRWRWRSIPTGRAFHTHTLIACGGQVLSASGAFVGGIQRRLGTGPGWQSLYEHPRVEKGISRVVDLAAFAGRCFAALRAVDQPGPKLLEVRGERIQPVPGTPEMDILFGLTAVDGWLYGLANRSDVVSLVRFDGTRWESVPAPDQNRLRALAANGRELLAVSGAHGHGALWSRRDNGRWQRVQSIDGGTPISVVAHRRQVFVGTFDERRGGSLWGPAQAHLDGGSEPPRLPDRHLPAQPASPEVADILARLDAVLMDPSSYADHAARLRRVLARLAARGGASAGEALSRRLTGALPKAESQTFTRVPIPNADTAQWFMLRTIGLIGAGRVPLTLLSRSWDRPANPAEKYFHPLPAAIWVAGILGQDDPDTLSALVALLRRDDAPRWLHGDAMGALTTLTGRTFGHDRTAWIRWWRSPSTRIRRNSN